MYNTTVCTIWFTHHDPIWHFGLYKCPFDYGVKRNLEPNASFDKKPIRQASHFFPYGVSSPSSTNLAPKFNKASPKFFRVKLSFGLPLLHSHSTTCQTKQSLSYFASSYTMINNLICANSKAVSFIEHGMYRDAVRVLSSAVKQCASTLFDPRDGPLSPACTSSTGLYVDASVSTSSKASHFTSSQQTDMFSHPFVMIHNELQDCTAARTSRELIARCAAVCFYNMGLACHLEWVQRHRNDSRVLSQAHCFYRKAYQSLQLCHLPSTDSYLLLMMAICTNLIDLNLELGQLATVQTLKENLTSVTSYADKQRYSGNASFRYLYQGTLLFRFDLLAARAAWTRCIIYVPNGGTVYPTNFLRHFLLFSRSNLSPVKKKQL